VDLIRGLVGTHRSLADRLRFPDRPAPAHRQRQVGQLAPFDLVLLLVLSNAVQNSMNGGDNSVLGGLISATTLIRA